MHTAAEDIECLLDMLLRKLKLGYCLERRDRERCLPDVGDEILKAFGKF
jgi:hypothetical protein